jgi:hypothetical protein
MDQVLETSTTVAGHFRVADGMPRSACRAWWVLRARLLDDPLEGLVQQLAFVWVQPAEKLLAQLGGRGIRGGELPPAALGDGDLEGSAVVWVSRPLSQSMVFQLVDDPDEGGLVHCDEVGQLTLGQAPPAEELQDSEVAHVHADWP